MIRRIKIAFPNDIVASNEAHIKLLKSIPAEELKKSLLQTMKIYGCTFAEEQFIRLITNNWYENIIK